MRYGHVCLSKNDFPKKINLIFCLYFYYPLLPKASKLFFHFTLDKDHPTLGTGALFLHQYHHSFHWGATLPFISFCLPHRGLTQFEYCSSKWLGFPLQQGFLTIFVSSKSSHVITK